MAPRIPPVNLPLRVNQLDAAASDDYIFDVIINRLKDVIKYLNVSNVFTEYQPEIEAVIKSCLWLFVLRKHSYTLGQQMLSLRYASIRDSASPTNNMPLISRFQSMLYLVFNVLCPWLHARVAKKFEERRTIQSFSSIHKIFLALNTLWASLSLANLLVFLVKGRQLQITERILGIQAVHPEGRKLREVSFELSNREIIWHGFAEFMIFAMPFVNMKRLKAIFSPPATGCLSESAWCCHLCEDYPSNPSQFDGCSHVYCYHCLASSLQADDEVKCVRCQCKVTSFEDIVPAGLKVS